MSKNKETNNIVAVYGSLKQGLGNHRLLEHSSASFLGKHQTKPEYTMLHLGGFPGLVKAGETPIQCELYSVDEDTMQRLDLLEGYPRFYDREQIETEHGDAWIYFLADGTGYGRRRVVESGNWGEE